MCPTLCAPMDCSMPGFSVFHYPSNFAQTHIHGADNATQPSHPLSPLSPTALNLSQYQHFRWPKYWSVSFSISPSSDYSGLISFRIDWFDLLAVQETLKSLLHYHSLTASLLWCSAFFMVQLSHLYTSRKNPNFVWSFVS